MAHFPLELWVALESTGSLPTLAWTLDRLCWGGVVGLAYDGTADGAATGTAEGLQTAVGLAEGFAVGLADGFAPATAQNVAAQLLSQLTTFSLHNGDATSST